MLPEYQFSAHRVSIENMGQLVSTREGAIAVLTLNRPERRNALSLGLMTELLAALREIAADKSVSAVILAAAGPVFCSGHDLNEMVDRTEEEHRRLFATCTELMTAIQSIPQPVIAEVQGMATAAGCQLVATCDLAIANTEAAFATPGVQIGLFCTTPMVALSRAVGRKRALEMLLTGVVVPAAKAAEWGLINSVAAVHELRAATRAMAARIAAASTYTVATGKQAFYRQIDLGQAEAYACAQETMTANALAADAQEGITAFLGKRPACWVGR